MSHRILICLGAGVFAAFAPSDHEFAPAAPSSARSKPLQADSLRDLPLIEVPAAKDSSKALVLFLSGDGGWAKFDRQIAERLAQRGAPVVGLDSRTYLTKKKRAPDDLAADMVRVLRHYLQKWNRQQIVVAGYSRGSEFVPFVVSRLPADLRSRTVLAVMLGPSTYASYEFHLSDLLFNTKRPTDISVLPELERIRGTRVLCVYGVDEHDSVCPVADSLLVNRLPLAGGHHFDGDPVALADLIFGAFTK
jgi:type IV secretory pathway VirJ component